MWDFAHQPLSGREHRYVLQRAGKPVSYGDVLRLWQEDEPFRSDFIATLKSSPFRGYRWETPPVNVATIGRDFEFVLLDTPALDREPDERSFASQCRAHGSKLGVAAFANLGKDAVLVVPCPAGPASAYVHLATFVRQAPAEQVHELWRLVGSTMASKMNAKPIWLSTAGMGVSWLHIRLDSRPKYYGYAPYRTPAS